MWKPPSVEPVVEVEEGASSRWLEDAEDVSDSQQGQHPKKWTSTSRIDVAHGASDISTVGHFWLTVAGMGEAACRKQQEDVVT